jgi:hypothetical protein
MNQSPIARLQVSLDSTNLTSPIFPGDNTKPVRYGSMIRAVDEFEWQPRYAQTAVRIESLTEIRSHIHRCFPFA